MAKIITYLDAGVLIVAYAGNYLISQKAWEIIDDPQREFVKSIFLELEILPKAIYHQQQAEVEFYQSFLASCQLGANQIDKIVQKGYEIATNFGVAAMDSLHLAAALEMNCDEFVTTEKVTKPLHRVTGIKIISINN